MLQKISVSKGACSGRYNCKNVNSDECNKVIVSDVPVKCEMYESK